LLKCFDGGDEICNLIGSEGELVNFAVTLQEKKEISAYLLASLYLKYMYKIEDSLERSKMELFATSCFFAEIEETEKQTSNLSNVTCKVT